MSWPAHHHASIPSRGRGEVASWADVERVNIGARVNIGKWINVGVLSASGSRIIECPRARDTAFPPAPTSPTQEVDDRNRPIPIGQYHRPSANIPYLTLHLIISPFHPIPPTTPIRSVTAQRITSRPSKTTSADDTRNTVPPDPTRHVVVRRPAQVQVRLSLSFFLFLFLFSAFRLLQISSPRLTANTSLGSSIGSSSSATIMVRIPPLVLILFLYRHILTTFAVGKTALITRFMYNQFDQANSTSTIGIDFASKVSFVSFGISRNIYAHSY